MMNRSFFIFLLKSSEMGGKQNERYTDDLAKFDYVLQMDQSTSTIFVVLKGHLFVVSAFSSIGNI
jgi:hypothetical protein